MLQKPLNLVWLAGVVLLAAPTTGARGAWQGTVEDVSFVARCDQSKQRYLLLIPKDFTAAEPHDLLILLHGHGSDRWQVLDDSVPEFRAGRDAAAIRGILVVSPDYRAKASWMGPKAEADIVQIIDDVRTRFHIEKVIVSGASMGGASSLTFAALHPELVDGVVSMNGTANHLEYERFQGSISKSFGGTKASVPLEYKKRSAEYWPERFVMPVAITASGQDKTVPPASVLRLANTIKILSPDNVLLIHREKTGHNTSYEDSQAAHNFVLERVSPLTSPKASVLTKSEHYEDVPDR